MGQASRNRPSANAFCSRSRSHAVVILNEKEYKKEVGTPPLAKYTRFVPQIQIYVFIWRPSLGHLRTLKMSYKTMAQRTMNRMSASQHLYEGQDDEVLSATVQNQIDAVQTGSNNGDVSGFAGTLSRLRTIASHKEKLGIAHDRDDDGEAPDNEQDEQHDGGSDDDDDKDLACGASNTPPPKRMQAHRSPGARTSLLGRPLPKPSRARDKPAAPPKAVATGAAASSAASVVSFPDGEDDAGEGPAKRGMLADPEAEVNKWILKLDLCSVMTDKTGVQEAHQRRR